jgi:ABC-type lipoprotein release transport system permease subunit
MILFRLALRNLIGAGLRTVLNVVVLSLVFVAIIGSQGLLEGMNRQASRAMVEAEYGGGQYWREGYDPYDPLSLQGAHGPLPAPLRQLVSRGQAVRQLIVQGTIYPGGRVRSVLVRGIDPEQKIITIPSLVLKDEDGDIPALIGERMSRGTGLRKGDYVTLRWRDRDGVFDARDVTVVEVMSTPVQSIDQGQLWLARSTLGELTGLGDEATLVTLSRSAPDFGSLDSWIFRDVDYLLRDIRDLVRSKSLGSMIVYIILLALAMLAVFDTQALSIFHRRKEIGTLIALGLTRGKVTLLFTLEGAIHGLLAVALGTAYGAPLLGWFERTGWKLPQTTDRYGFAIGDVLYPHYGPRLVIATVVLVLLITAVVSYIPARRILRMNPTDALRGKLL